jgi:peptidoglycan/xylan/chitin deacetylase (PgdA/CDA1 family)
MSALIKNSVFLASKYLGLFAISNWLLRNKVRVLCYHAFTTIDEHLNVPGLFIEPEVFADRMNYLKRKGYKVISLDEAYQDVSNGVKANNRVVITIDDGFVSVLNKAAPILKQYDFPSTLYLTSYYFDKNCPVFTLAVGYMFWKTEISDADFSSLQIPALNTEKDCSLNAENKNKIEIAVKEYGQPLKGNQKRVELLERLGEILQVDYKQLNKDRLFNLVNKQELNELQQYGVDIQLHTHRHTFPVDQEIAKKEIRDNKDAINPLLEKPMKHFCYPSGVWSEHHWDALSQEQVLSATTCQIGLVDEKTPQFAWPRILDSARVSQIEFEAEVSGFNELLRMVRS